MIDRVKSFGAITPQQTIAACLDAIGPLMVSDATLRELLTHALKAGDLAWDSDEAVVESENKVGKILTLIAASRDYQFA
mgnify:FL=1